MKQTMVLFVAALTVTYCQAQKEFNNYVRFYPIGDDPNINYKTSYRKEETLLFEANPTVRFSVYNNFIKGLQNGDCHTQAWYVSFRPQIRMYTENSLPVKTPSYKILIGTQHLFRMKNNNFFAFSLESGHYSNGQAGCAFTTQFPDGSSQCDSIYATITPSTDLSKLLNRSSGNFSTNLTELILNFRLNAYDDELRPCRVHSFKAGLTYYHDRFLGIADFGGYSANDINIYGHYRWLLGYQHDRVLKKGDGMRLSFSENIELISGAHSWVNPLRSETIFSIFPFRHVREIGFFAAFISGHDNYNFRFVDAGSQFSAGLTWCQFPPFAMDRLR